MRTPVLFLLAMVTPLLLAALLCLPIYASLFGAAYIIYAPASGAHPLTDRWADVFYISETYGALLHYWLSNMATLSWVEYALPIVGLPVLGMAFAFWATWRVTRKLLNVFHLSASIH